MQVTHTKNFFIAEGFPRATVTRAGFAYSRKHKVWATPFAQVALKLYSCADADTQAEIVARIKIEREVEMDSGAVYTSKRFSVPEGLSLLPFQRAGVAWILERINTLLADEMGLGKTVQCIVAINELKPRTVLIICPASLKQLWKNELEKWLTIEMEIGISVGKKYSHTQINIINYDILDKHKSDLASQTWDLLIIDEVHYLKNGKTKRAKAVVETPIKAKRKIALSGTPLVNRPAELFTVLKYLSPFGFANRSFFEKRYCAAYYGDSGWDNTGHSNLAELQQKLRSSLMIRREKAMVLWQLPNKTRQVVPLKIDRTDLAELNSVIAPDMSYGDAMSKLREGSIEFDTISKYRRMLGEAKVDACIEHISGLLKNVDKLVVFAWHKHVVTALSDAFPRSLLITGGTPVKHRQGIVERFQNDKNVNLFIGNIKAAGTGITLTAASTVVFVELDWVPGNVTQAEDRCHRIGQTSAVLVQHLVVDSSLDINMAKAIIKKQKVIDKTVNSNAAVNV